ncbi:hypothetical protein EDB86DRAFT_2836704 [Lactarius hatsudake]|nr:hypothetical protein EDB86DRAFT_2836704 [Lactarius hatsudake]
MRRSGAPPLEPPSPRVHAQGCEQVTTQKRPPSPATRARKPPPYALQGRTGWVVHDQAACKSGAHPLEGKDDEWGAGQHGACASCTHLRANGACKGRKWGLPARDKTPLCARASIHVGMGELHGKGTRKPGAAPSLTPAQERRVNGRGRIGKGCAQQGANVRVGSGVRTPFALTWNKGPGRADTNSGMRGGGLYGMERTPPL